METRAVRLPAFVRRLSRKARLALSLAALASVLLAAAIWLLPSATLTIVCRHDFRRGDITVAIDDDVVLTDTVSGSVSRRWFGVVEKTAGSYTRTLSVPTGRRTVEVRLRAPGYDRTRRIQADFRRGRQSVLGVDSGRDLSLAWRAAGPASGAGEVDEGPDSPPPWLKYAGSVVFTILGSVVSASIGVFLQDYLRARKARKEQAAAATQPRPDR